MQCRLHGDCGLVAAPVKHWSEQKAPLAHLQLRQIGLKAPACFFFDRGIAGFPSGPCGGCSSGSQICCASGFAAGRCEARAVLIWQADVAPPPLQASETALLDMNLGQSVNCRTGPAESGLCDRCFSNRIQSTGPAAHARTVSGRCRMLQCRHRRRVGHSLPEARVTHHDNWAAGAALFPPRHG